MRHEFGIVVLQGVAAHERLHEFLLAERTKFNALRSAQDCGKQALRFIRDKEKGGFCRRFFKNFQEFVGRRLVHELWQPHEHHLIPALARFEAQLLQNAFALLDRDDGLLVFNAHALIPCLTIEIDVVGELFAPLRQIGVAHGFASRLRFNHRKDEMEVGVNPTLHHAARLTLPTGFAANGMLAKQGRGVGQHHGQFAASFRPSEQLGMRHTLLQQLALEEVLYVVLSDDV